MKRVRASLKQAGMVSIMVTLILMIVLSLIVLGFAQIARRNSRQVLDNQLSTQAFYAAETGVNDVRHLLQTAIQNGTPIPAKPDCTNGSGAEQIFYGSPAPLGLSPIIDAQHKVSYSCIMVNPTPSTLSYSNVNSRQGIVAPLLSSGNPIAKLNFTWQAQQPVNLSNCPASTSGVFSTTGSSGAWTCAYGVLRFDLVPTAGGLTQAGLQANTMTSFAVPLRGAGINSVGYSTNGAADVLGIHCTASAPVACSLDVTGLSGTAYYLRVLSLYQPVSLQVTATDASGVGVPLTGTQAIIDATGKAQDVLRRVQVHVPLLSSSQNQLSDYALESTSAICKRFEVMSGYFNSDADAAVGGVAAGNPTNQMCQ
ncbi:MAG TPA: hypothetical protein VLF91_01165 [Candidatus Saccharimonadales bacterium]|nr:hypothetical protein [Candidatus Saccharimonadales bacterium]